MVVRPSGGFHGSIGGGELERQALEAAQAALSAGRGAALSRTVALGPELGQCCGGRVVWRVETFDARDAAALAILRAAEREGPFVALARLGGDGRVERRLAQRLAPRSRRRRRTSGARPSATRRRRSISSAPAMSGARWRWRWRRCPSRCAGSTRARGISQAVPANVAMVAAADPPAELRGAPDGALVAVMTHSHALDLAIVAEALAQGRFPYVGLIGSATKRARFVSQLHAAGLHDANVARLICPIGVPGVEGKAPAVIAAAVSGAIADGAGVGERSGPRPPLSTRPKTQ